MAANLRNVFVKTAGAFPDYCRKEDSGKKSLWMRNDKNHKGSRENTDRMKSGSRMIVYLHAFALVVTVTTFWKSR